ncbi:MAG: glycosyltransferase family 4 protein, partial [Planctomycetota bacterium]
MIVKAGQLADSQNSFMLPSCEQANKSVLHLINGEHFAGAERVQDLLAKCLPKYGYEADFVCLKIGKFAEVRRSNSTLYQLNMRNSFDFSIANSVSKIVRENDYKFLHAHTPRSLMVGATTSIMTGLPLIYHVHSPVGRD